MGSGKVTVNLSERKGIPLLIKIAMFDSGFVPLERTNVTEDKEGRQPAAHGKRVRRRKRNTGNPHGLFDR